MHHRIRSLVRLCVAGTPMATHATDTWILRTDLWQSPAFSTLIVNQDAKALRWRIGWRRHPGQLDGNAWTLQSTDTQGRTSRYRLRFEKDAMNGTADLPDPNNPSRRVTHAVTGWKVPARDGGTRTWDYRPTSYSNTWRRRPLPGARRVAGRHHPHEHAGFRRRRRERRHPRAVRQSADRAVLCRRRRARRHACRAHPPLETQSRLRRQPGHDRQSRAWHVAGAAGGEAEASRFAGCSTARRNWRDQRARPALSRTTPYQ